MLDPDRSPKSRTAVSHEADPPSLGKLPQSKKNTTGTLPAVSDLASDIANTNDRVDDLYPELVKQAKDIGSISGSLQVAAERLAMATVAWHTVMVSPSPIFVTSPVTSAIAAVGISIRRAANFSILLVSHFLATVAIGRQKRFGRRSEKLLKINGRELPKPWT
ncbi:MAG: hypothetical protein GY798_30600 [Hyphomicrobiales bacterium]|nr:hypothetical protein [Hyphomicrobiales bacterium]